MVKVRDIYEILNGFAPYGLQESYDNSGLQVGDFSADSNGILLAVDVTEKVVDEAIREGINTIVSHHPLIFGGINKITAESATGRIIMEAVRHGISIISCHTNIDKAYNGVSYRMGTLLGLTGMRPLSAESLCDKSPADSDSEITTGLGVIGTLPTPLSFENFADKVKDAFSCDSIRHSRVLKPMISTVALCGGSGGSFLSLAAASGADVYVTADLRYHDFFKAEESITTIDAGHFETERCVIDIFYDILTKNFTNFAVRRTSEKTNPVIYLH